mgnify:CR=1 FL=1
MLTSRKKIKIKNYDINLILKEPILLSRLRELTLSPRSGMNYELNNFKKIANVRPVQASALVVYLENEIIAWALLSRENSKFSFKNFTEFNAGHGILFEVYVDHAHRRRGVGSILLKKARKIANGTRLCIAPHDYPSDRFYEKIVDFDHKVL